MKLFANSRILNGGIIMYSFKDEEKKQMMNEIQYFFKEEHDLDIGIIGSENIFHFFEEFLGNRIYNIALDDAKKFYQRYANDMDTDYYALFKDVK